MPTKTLCAVCRRDHPNVFRIRFELKVSCNVGTGGANLPLFIPLCGNCPADERTIMGLVSNHLPTNWMTP